MRTFRHFIIWLGLWLLSSYRLYAQDTTWTSLHKKATDAFYAGKYQQASQGFEQARTLAAQQFGRQHPNYVTTCNDLGDTYTEQGLYLKAAPLYQEARRIIRTRGNTRHPGYAANCASLGILYYKMGQYQRAEPWYQRALEADKKENGVNHPYYAESCNNLAALYMAQGKYRLAETLYTTSRRIRTKTPGKKSREYAEATSNLANLYTQQGNYVTAERLYLEARNIDKELLGPKHPNYITDCSNLARNYLLQKKYSQAEKLFIEARNTSIQVLGKLHPIYADCCNNIGYCYELQGDYNRAEPLYQEAQQIRKQVNGVNSVDYAESSFNLANIYFEQRKYNLAERLYLSVQQIYAQKLGKAHPLHADVINNLAHMYTLQQQYSKAAPLFEKTIQNKLAQMKVLLPTLSEYNRLQYIQSINDFFSSFYRFATHYYTQTPNIAAELLNLRLQIKGRLFESFQQVQQQVLASGDSSLIGQYQAWQGQRSYLAKVLELSAKQRKQQQVNLTQLTQQVDSLETVLTKSAARLPGFRKVSRLQSRISWKQLRRKLKKDEALIEMVRVARRQDTVYVALVITRQSRQAPQMIILKNGQQLESRYIRYYQNTMKFKRQDRYSYAQFWARLMPALRKVKNLRKIYFSPDGVYHQISLSTLRNPKTKRYLLEDYQLQVLGTPRDLIEYRQPQQQTQRYQNYKVYLFGYPSYNQTPKEGNKNSIKKDRSLSMGLGVKIDSAQRFFKGGNISLLPGTKTEVENIDLILQKKGIKPTIYMQEKASESRIKQLLSPDILHIATHGFFLPKVENEANTTQQNSPRNFAGISLTQFNKNPLLRSGLLFAGAENTLKNGKSQLNQENGILTAEEALTLNLINTKLVVMSACETGLGKISNGEGVYGLQRTFQQAGAQTLLMSLWKVSDKATQQMMTMFYENLFLKNQDKRVAFRNAQLKLKEVFPHPYYWGAFVLIGR